jgi:hypothetical protein
VGILAIRIAGCVCGRGTGIDQRSAVTEYSGRILLYRFADTCQEANGLLYADRTPKFPLQDIALAVTGPRTTRDVTVEWPWRERLMNHQRTR